MKFRTSLKKDIPLRLIDFIGHVGFAILLPGHWVYQFSFDLWLPVIFIYSFYTNTLLPENNMFLAAHRFNHTIYGPIALGLIYGLLTYNAKWGMQVCVQGLAHVIWDQFTHEQKYQRRSLWRI